MDGKLALMAKSTVFAGCRRQELLTLGRLFEVARLGPGSILPAGDGRWLHVVLDGRALAVVQGQAQAIIGSGEILRPRTARTSRHDLRARDGLDGLVVLTETTLASISTRSLGAVTRCSPEVAARLAYDADPVEVIESLERPVAEFDLGRRFVGAGHRG